MTGETKLRDAGRTRSGMLAHVLGNILLGVSLGLLSYYGVTDIMAGGAQAVLQDDLTGLGEIARDVPRIRKSAASGWEGWEEQDLRYWRGLEEGGVFGRLVIPEMELDVVVVKGTSREDLKKGPGWIVQTDPPGPTGNAGISGHRTTYGAPFRRLDELIPGDTIQFYSPYRRYTYEMVEQLVVTPDQTWVVASTEEPMLTLTACHPLYSARFRIVVRSELVDVALLEE